ncbi:DMT family transporter [Synechococcus sp. Tobar12-5m-g]|uniref:DMT family transporter n=1 Tax=unclassified Synechococcus TaxID=2626047 RepID=UPI0020CF45C8|nr:MULTISPECIES: DMT family transporter [unclassified Synechococcus]MCP9772154.1 DMT family transporter [Synechococcus sp. Tobar12-5m-g]MCP9873175.1 DMT family transporter [Synechococcus sp. Cruz CV-v-12]
MLASALAFSLMGVCVKAVGPRLPVSELVLARSVVSLVLSLAMLRQAGLSPWGQRQGLLLVRGLLGSVALYCVFAALTRLPLAAATVIQYLHPTFTALLAWALLGERLSWRVLLAAVVGWIGVLLLTDPAGFGAPGAGLPWTGVMLALAGSLLSALAYVSVRALGRSEHPLVIVFYFPLVGLALSLPLVLLDPVLPNRAELGWLLGVGVLTQLGQLALTRGLLGLPAGRATAVSYVQVPLAALWGLLWFGESLDPDILAAAGLVLGATLLSLGP